MIFLLDTSSSTYAHRSKSLPKRSIRHQRINIDAVRSAAERDWPGVIAQLASISIDCLDGGHHPCPRCGGTDRFNFCRSGTGALFCNQCQPEGTRDGFGSVAWLCGTDFKDSLRSVAELCGITASPGRSPSSTHSTDQSPPSLPKPKSRPKRTDISEEEANLRHEVYSRLAEVFGLSGKHRDELRARGLSDQEASHRGYWSFGHQGQSLKLMETGLHKRAKEIAKLVPGVFPGGSLMLSLKHSAMMIPVRDIDGRIVAVRCRADDSRSSNKYFWLTSKSKKLDGPSPGAIHHIPLKPVSGFEHEPTGILAITEGEIKADVATSLSKSLVVSIPGVNSWRSVLPVIDDLEPKHVQIAMDADAALNKAVGSATVKLFRELSERSDTKVSVLVWDTVTGRDGELSPKGLDDCLASGVEPTVLSGAEAEKYVVDLASRLDIRQKLDDLLPFEDPMDPARLARVNLRRYREKLGGDLVFWQGKWWKYRDGRYRRLIDQEIDAKVRIGLDHELLLIAKNEQAGGDGEQPMKKKISISLVKNVVDAMKREVLLSPEATMPCLLNDRTQRHNLLSLQNGLLDVDAVAEGNPVEESFQPHTPAWFSTRRLDYEFDAKAECPLWLRYLQQALPDQDSQKTVQEWAGYLLSNRNDRQKFMALEGDGSAGKSVFAAGLRALIGDENISYSSLKQFGTRFGLSATLGASLNIDSDVERHAKFSVGDLKKYVAGEPMDFELKGGDLFCQVPTAKLLLIWNHRPKIDDESSGFWRRMLLIQFTQVVAEADQVVGMDKPWFWRSRGEVPGMLNWAIAGLRRLQEQGRFTQSDAMKRAIGAYKTDNDPVQAFLEEEVSYSQSSPVFTSTQSLVAAFRFWCQANASDAVAKEMNERSMGRHVAKRFGIGTIRKTVSLAESKEKLRGFVGITVPGDDADEEETETKNSLLD